MGSAWSRTSVTRLLPAAQKSHLNDPAVTGVFEQSADSIYATGNGNTEVDMVSRIPGTTEELAGGFTHALNNPGVNEAGTLLAFGS